jgi:hypothetical protein
MMGNWTSMLKADAIMWLLEKDNPSVRYFTLKELLDKTEADPEVAEAKKAIMNQGAVPHSLAKMRQGGYWETPASFYASKYKGTVWQLLTLAELGADPQDDRVKSACDFILTNSQHSESGGFSMAHSERMGGGRESGVIPCLTGNMVYSLIRLGYLGDPRVQAGINWIARYQRFDDGDGAPKGQFYDRFEACFGKHTCHMGAAKALKALAEIPLEHQNPQVKTAVASGVEYFLKHHIYKKSHDLAKVSKPGWLKFGFPLMYQTDALEILGILAKLGCKDPRMKQAIELVVSKQTDEGKWLLESSFNGKYQVDIERRGEPSKWVTLNALKTLKQLCG